MFVGGFTKVSQKKKKKNSSNPVLMSSPILHAETTMTLYLFMNPFTLVSTGLVDGGGLAAEDFPTAGVCLGNNSALEPRVEQRKV